MESVIQDVYAESSHGPMQSKLKTIRKFLACWGLPLVPYTPEVASPAAAVEVVALDHGAGVQSEPTMVCGLATHGTRHEPSVQAVGVTHNHQGAGVQSQPTLAEVTTQ